MKVFIFDFDGTITTEDTTDLILGMLDESEIWQIEDDWKAGEILSYQCMKAQARFLRGITIGDVYRHLKRHSQVDPTFLALVDYLEAENFYTVVLSEGYDLSLRYHGVQTQIGEVYCSRLMTEDGRLTGELEVLNEKVWKYNEECLGCCICKVEFLHQLSERCDVTESFAVGDGGSDGCLFQYVDVSFSLDPKYEATHQVSDLSDVLQIIKKNAKH